MLFARFDCNCHHWATNGLNYYVLAKLLWNRYRDVDEIVEDYCTVGFGPAAETVQRYFEEIERITTAIAEERQRPTPDTIARHYTDEILEKLHRILDEAEQEAGYNAQVKKRVAFLRCGLEYAPICRDYLVAEEIARDGGDKWLWRKYMEELVRRTTWFQQLGPSWVIYVPWLIYWAW